jgi:hypothetical protein
LNESNILVDSDRFSKISEIRLCLILDRLSNNQRDQAIEADPDLIISRTNFRDVALLRDTVMLFEFKVQSGKELWTEI